MVFRLDWLLDPLSLFLLMSSSLLRVASELIISPPQLAMEMAASLPEGSINPYNKSSKLRTSSYLRKAEVPPTRIAYRGTLTTMLDYAPETKDSYQFEVQLFD